MVEIMAMGAHVGQTSSALSKKHPPASIMSGFHQLCLAQSS